MANLMLRSIARQVRDLNVSKSGYTSYYVDVTNGNDAYDGESWETAFATIQHAIDEAGSWAIIYAKSGTYTENLNIPTSKDHLEIHGEDAWTTYIIGADNTDDTIDAQANYFRITGCQIEATGTKASVYYSTGYGATRIVVDNCILYSENGYGVSGGHPSVIEDCVICAKTGILISGGGGVGNWREAGFKIHRNKFIGHYAVNDTAIDIYYKKCEIHDNYFVDYTVGIELDSQADVEQNAIYHNSFESCTTAIDKGVLSGANYIAENYYSDHTNVDSDGDGICDTAYAFTGGIDKAPLANLMGFGGATLGCGHIKTCGYAETEGTATGLNAHGGTAASGATGADLVTISMTTRKMIHYLGVQISGFETAATITIRGYKKTKNGGSMRKFYDADFIVGTDPDEIPVIDSSMAFRNDVRIEVQSDNALDTNESADWEYITEDLE